MKPKFLPFTTVQPGGARQIKFPLHEHTVNAGHVGVILEMLLESMTKQIHTNGDVSDGDVLQALCMALAIRMHMVKAPPDTVRATVAVILQQADDAVVQSVVQPVSRA